MSDWARRQIYIKKKITLKDDARDCGYNKCGYCSNDDCDYYFVKCPFKTLDECAVHNEEL